MSDSATYKCLGMLIVHLVFSSAGGLDGMFNDNTQRFLFSSVLCECGIFRRACAWFRVTREILKRLCSMIGAGNQIEKTCS